MTLIYTLEKLCFVQKIPLTKYKGLSLQMLWYSDRDSVRLYGMDENDFSLSVPAEEIDSIHYRVTLLIRGTAPRSQEFRHTFEHAAVLERGMIINLDMTTTMCERTLPLDEIFGLPRDARYGWQFSD